MERPSGFDYLIHDEFNHLLICSLCKHALEPGSVAAHCKGGPHPSHHTRDTKSAEEWASTLLFYSTKNFKVLSASITLWRTVPRFDPPPDILNHHIDHIFFLFGVEPRLIAVDVSPDGMVEDNKALCDTPG